MNLKIKTALVSVSDKENILSLLKILKKYKIKILSSGGTYTAIKKLGYSCTELSKYTGFKEMLDGRVKTLHPKIHAGILHDRQNRGHKNEMSSRKFPSIDLIVVNFYPFQKVVRSSKSSKDIIENIDIGGPTLVRSAAKNFKNVTILTNKKDYPNLIKELEKNKGKTSLKFRELMSSKAFGLTAYYDAMIANWFNRKLNIEFPERKTIFGRKLQKLRYGENPHQESSIYVSDYEDQKLGFTKLHGKELSYNNYNDIFSALAISKTFPKNRGVVIVKHANPCGVSIIKEKINCYKAALACDPVSAFGGIVSCNFKINKKLALELKKIFFEVIIANGFDKNALKVLRSKKNLRLIDSSLYRTDEILKFNSINDNILIQSEDKKVFYKNDFKIVSKKRPSKSQLDNLIFAFNVCRYVKSNAIVLANNLTTIGVGSGQPSRLDSCEIAINKMNRFINKKDEIVAASDAFFPFVDGIEKLVQSGVTAVVQPSGSIRDKEIIKFANATDTVLIFSKTRHFRH